MDTARQGKGHDKKANDTGIKKANVQGNNWFIVRKKNVVYIGKIWKLRCETLKFENVKFNFRSENWEKMVKVGDGKMWELGKPKNKFRVG